MKNHLILFVMFGLVGCGTIKNPPLLTIEVLGYSDVVHTSIMQSIKLVDELKPNLITPEIASAILNFDMRWEQIHNRLEEAGEYYILLIGNGAKESELSYQQKVVKDIAGDLLTLIGEFVSFLKEVKIYGY